MPFIKGKSGNPDGRPQGTKNKLTTEWEAMGESLIGSWTDYVKEKGNQYIEEDRFDDFYNLYKDMVNYFKPRLQAAHNKNENKNETSLDLSNAEIVDRINRILAAASGEDAE